MNFPLLASLFAFISILLLCGAFISAGKAKKALLNSRLHKYTNPNAVAPNTSGQKERGRKGAESSLRQALRLFACLPAPADWRQKTERELARAGLSLHAAEYLALRIILIIIFAPVVFSLSGSMLMAVLAAFAAALLPPFFVKSAQHKRVVQFNNQLGDALTVMANSLRAGFSFMQAADTVSKEMPAPLALEFSRLLREIKLGVTMEDALQNMLERVNSRDLELLITAVKIQRQVGGNLAEILDNIGETIRERIRLKNELKTLTAQGRISGLIIGLLPVLIVAVVSLINPGYMLTLITNPLGPLLLLWAAGSEIIGLILIRRIVSLDY